MQLLRLLLVFATSTSAIEIQFLSAVTLPISLNDYFPPAITTNETARAEQRKHFDLLKRQNNCPTDFHACTNLNAPNLCCADAAVCQPDNNGRVACCPSSSRCTGTVSGVITAGTVNSVGRQSGGASATASTTNNGGGAVTSNSGAVVISNNPSTTENPTASGSSFVVVGNAAVRGAEVPLMVKGILKVLQCLPI